MRKTFLITASAFLLFAVAVHAQKNETIEGNGKLVTRTVAVQSFDALKASGVYELKLTQGNKEEVKIEADENLQDYFTVRNEGAKLVIDMKRMEHKNLNAKNKMRVFITFRKLKDLELSTVGNVSADTPLSFDEVRVNNQSVGKVNLNLTANKFNLDNKSVGNVKLSGSAQAAVVKNTGVGNLSAGSFVVQTMDIENTGVGSAEVNAEKELKVKDSFLGKVRNRGAASARKLNREII